MVFHPTWDSEDTGCMVAMGCMVGTECTVACMIPSTTACMIPTIMADITVGIMADCTADIMAGYMVHSIALTVMEAGDITRDLTTDLNSVRMFPLPDAKDPVLCQIVIIQFLLHGNLTISQLQIPATQEEVLQPISRAFRIR